MHRQLYGICAILAVLVGAGAWTLIQRRSAETADLVISGRTPLADSPTTAAVPPDASPKSVAPPAAGLIEPAVAPKEVVVHVAGAVKKPGVYHLKPEARAEDALKAAGGAQPDANLDAINLAGRVEDGRQLYFPTKKEQPSGGAPEQTLQISTSSKAKADSSKGHTASHGSKLSKPGQGTVNINSASLEELQRLPGVGPAMAARIMEFRKTSGSFSAIDQLMDVSGIGPKKFEKMRPFVRLK